MKEILKAIAGFIDRLDMCDVLVFMAVAAFAFAIVAFPLAAVIGGLK